MSKKGLFIMDMVNGMVHSGPMSSEEVATIVPYIVALTKQFRKHKHPVYAFAPAYEAESPVFAIYPPHCLAHTSESEVIPEILPLLHKANVIFKNSTNPWHDIYTRLVVDQMLEDGVVEMYIVGCHTDVAILQFALNLKTYLQSKHVPVAVKVVHESVATYETPQHDAKAYQQIAFELLAKAGIEII
ncbi:MAG: cysteine hydrolase family protein [Culicoidibacterales bacterium]